MGVHVSDPLRVACNTSTGNQTLTFTWADGSTGLTPKAVLLIVTRGVTDGTAADGGGFYWGMSDGTNEATGSYEAQHAQASMDVQLTQDTTADRILTIHDGTADSVVEAQASFVSFGSDNCVINWTDAPASAFLLTAIAYGGTDLSAAVFRQDLGNVADALIDITSIGFEADNVICFMNNTLATGVSMGVIHNNRGGTVTQRAVFHGNRNTFSSSQANAVMRTDACIVKNQDGGSNDYWGTATSFDSSGFSVQLANARSPSNADIAGLALRYGTSAVVDSKVYTYSTPTGTGSNTDSTPNFTAQSVLYIANRTAVAATIETDADGGAFGVVALSDSVVYSNAIADEDGAADSNTQSLSDDILVLTTHTGASGHAATLTSMGSTGPVWNFSATDATARLWPALAIQVYSAGTTAVKDIIGGGIIPFAR